MTARFIVESGKHAHDGECALIGPVPNCRAVISSATRCVAYNRPCRDEGECAVIDRAYRFHFITTFDAIHDQTKPLNVLKGIYLMQDISGSSHVHKDIEHMHALHVGLAGGW